MSKWFSEEDYKSFVAKVKKDQEDAENSGSSSTIGKIFPKYTKPYDTVYTLRFLPAMKDKNPAEFYRKLFVHVFQGQDGNWIWLTCPWTFDDHKCPICRIVSKLYSSGEPEDQNMAQRLQKQPMWVANVYVCDDPRDEKRDAAQKINGTVKIFPFKVQVERKLSKALSEGRQGVGLAAFDPEEGFDFFLTVREKKTAKATFPNYEESDFARGKPTAIKDSEKEIKEIIDQTYSLEDYIENERTSKERLLEVLESEMLLGMLEDYEAQQYRAEEPLGAEEDVPASVDGLGEKKENPQKPDPVEETQEKKKDTNLDEEDAKFLAELDEIEF